MEAYLAEESPIDAEMEQDDHGRVVEYAVRTVLHYHEDYAPGSYPKAGSGRNGGQSCHQSGRVDLRKIWILYNPTQTEDEILK